MEKNVLEKEGRQASARMERRLNPDAREWDISRDRGSEEQRCLYLTFSKGFPLHEYEIAEFFNEKYGPCVERVYVNRRIGESPPMFGKVVFRYSIVPAAVLKNGNQARFIVNSKPMWCKRYQPNN